MRIEISMKKKSFKDYLKELVRDDLPAEYIKLVLKGYFEDPKSYKCMAGVIRYNISDEWIIADIIDKYDDDIICSSLVNHGEFIRELSVGMNEETFFKLIGEIKKISPNKKIVIY